MFIELEKLKEKYDNHLVDVNDIDNNIKSLYYLMNEFKTHFDVNNILVNDIRYNNKLLYIINIYSYSNDISSLIFRKIDKFISDVSATNHDLYEKYISVLFKYMVNDYKSSIELNDDILSFFAYVIFLDENNLNYIEKLPEFTIIFKELNCIQYLLIKIIQKFKYISVNNNNQSIKENLNNSDQLLSFNYKDRIVYFDKKLAIEYIRNEIYNNFNQLDFSF